MSLKHLKLSIFCILFTFSTVANECDFVKPSITLPDSISSNIKILNQSFTILEADGNEYVEELSELKKYDKRKVKTSSSPSYLDAVGKLVIKTKDNKYFICTAFLVSNKQGASSDIIGSAAHCINKFTNTDIHRKEIKDISSIQWTTTVGKTTITRDAQIINYDFEGDALLLKLDSKVAFSSIKPLLIDTENVVNPAIILDYDVATKIVNAGFHADEDLGKGGNVLTYDDSILSRKIDYDNYYIKKSNYSKTDILPQTVTWGGGSGSPLIAELDLTEEGIDNPHGQMYVIGVLKGLSTNKIEQGKSVHHKDKITGSIGTTSPIYKDYAYLAELMNKASQ